MNLEPERNAIHTIRSNSYKTGKFLKNFFELGLSSAENNISQRVTYLAIIDFRYSPGPYSNPSN